MDEFLALFFDYSLKQISVDGLLPKKDTHIFCPAGPGVVFAID